MDALATIASLNAVAVSVPISNPFRFSTRSVTHREYLLVSIVDSDGVRGTGWTYAGTSGGRLLADVVVDLFAPLVIGTPVAAIEQRAVTLMQEYLLLGRRGAITRALSALDIAAWDNLSRRANLPLCAFFGGAATSVRAYASGGYYRDGDPLAHIESELLAYLDLGFDAFKIKFGGLPLAEDLRRVERAREVIGNGARLALDVNNGWADVTDALRAARELEAFDIWWIEEPFVPDDIRSHRRLTVRTNIPIATGEIEGSPLAFGKLLEDGAADVLQPDACVIGGVTAWFKVARAAETFGVSVAPHWHASLHAQLAAATPNCLAVEYFDLRHDICKFEALVERRLQIRDGAIILDSTPGTGVNFNEEAIRQFTIASRTGLE